MPVEERVNPLQERPVVSQQPDAGSDRRRLGPGRDVYVVVHLQVPDAQVLDKEIDDFVEVLASAAGDKSRDGTGLVPRPFRRCA